MFYLVNISTNNFCLKKFSSALLFCAKFNDLYRPIYSGHPVKKIYVLPTIETALVRTKSDLLPTRITALVVAEPVFHKYWSISSAEFSESGSTTL